MTGRVPDLYTRILRETRSGIVSKLEGGHVTFLFAAKDEEFNNATALIEYLQQRLERF